MGSIIGGGNIVGCIIERGICSGEHSRSERYCGEHYSILIGGEILWGVHLMGDIMSIIIEGGDKLGSIKGEEILKTVL